MNEIESYLSNKKTIIFTQFQSFNKRNIVYLNEINNYLKVKNISINCPVVINRTAPNTIFISLSSDKKMEFQLIRNIKKYSLINKNKIKLVTI